jgi:hypothetical protein
LVPFSKSMSQALAKWLPPLEAAIQTWPLCNTLPKFHCVEPN